jgi:hypothetical protein
MPTIEEVERKPWRYVGYPGFAKWTASDNDFFVLRRFDGLATRVLLWRQWQLTKLEKKLATLDFERSSGTTENFNNGSFECDDDDRQTCIRSACHHLNQYCINVDA